MKFLLLIPLLALSLPSVAKEGDECAMLLQGQGTPAIQLGIALLQDGVEGALIGRDSVEASNTVISHISVLGGGSTQFLTRQARIQITKDPATKLLAFEIQLSATPKRPNSLNTKIEEEYLRKDALKYPIRLGGLTREGQVEIEKQRDGSFRAQMKMSYRQSPGEEAEDSIFYVAIVLKTMWLGLPAM